MERQFVLQWTRTALMAIGFVWVMLAWRAHDAPERHVEELSARLCVGSADDRDGCELNLRLRVGGRGIAVTGSVDVSGSVDVLR